MKRLLLSALLLISGCGSAENRPPLYDAKMAQFRQHRSSSRQPMMIGDSITEAWESDGTFPSTWTNRGIGGDKSSGVLGRIYEHLSEGPSEVVLLIGTNELSHSPGEYSSNLRNIIGMIKASGVPLTIVSILPRIDYVSTAGEVRVFNAALGTLCQQYGVKYREISGYFQLPSGATNTALYADVVHLNHNGYTLLAALLNPSEAK